LSDDLKTPFLLKYAYDCSLKEIGRILKISENNVAVRLHRAKSKLIGMLKKEGLSNET
jgi:RNA polymerase sigma-70 factor (ECF subfamily)